ncbi:hypothetical protein EG68_00597 [Paragonimus skrjabini miyazakii]|uniref:PID domain-containing protein n=1 Tax=Paragonimus skrjabini miyazakii TaxID=59628 RepID=A0A8S9Z9Q7_9TREM|nr:hypothetical protein EG68_00597 [Paragonimus skrjabini miyazakii]
MEKKNGVFPQKSNYGESEGASHSVTMSFAAKLFGKLQVRDPKGDMVCETALSLLKACLLNSKAGKKRVTIKLHLAEFKVLDRKSKELLEIYRVSDITYIWKDPIETNSCGIIMKQPALGENGFEFLGFKLRNGPSLLIGALKHVIQWSQTGRTQINTPNQQDQFINDLIDLDEQSDDVSAVHDTTSINTQKPKPLISCIQSSRLSIDEIKRQRPESIKDQQWTHFDCSFTQGCDTLESTKNWDPWNVNNEVPARNLQWPTSSLWPNDSSKDLPGHQISSNFPTSAAITLSSYTSEKMLPNPSAQIWGTNEWSVSLPKPQTNSRNPFVQSWTSNQPIETSRPAGQSTVNWCDAIVSRGAGEQV